MFFKKTTSQNVELLLQIFEAENVKFRSTLDFGCECQLPVGNKILAKTKRRCKLQCLQHTMA